MDVRREEKFQAKDEYAVFWVSLMFALVQMMKRSYSATALFHL